eukprot:gene10025-20872_t
MISKYIDFIYRFRWFSFVGSFIGIIVLGFLGKGKNPDILVLLLFHLLFGVTATDAFTGLHAGGFTPPKSQSTTATNSLTNSVGYPDFNEYGVIVLLESPQGWTVDDPQFRTEYNKVAKAFKNYPMLGVISYYEYPEQTRMVSDNRKKVLLLGRPITKDENVQIMDALSVSSLTIKLGGAYPTRKEQGEEILKGVKAAEFYTLPFIFVLLIFTLGSVAAGLTPWLVAGMSVCGTLALLVAFDYGFRVSSIASNVVTMFGLGLGIDYSLFIVTRFCEDRIKYPDVAVSSIAQRTLETSGRTVLFSALTVFLSLTGGLMFREFFLASMCLSVMLAAACAAIGSGSILLSLLCILDKNIFFGSTVFITDAIQNKLKEIFILPIYSYCISNNSNQKTNPNVSSILENPSTTATQAQEVGKINNNTTTNNNNISNSLKISKDDNKYSTYKTNNTNNNDDDGMEDGFWYNIGKFVTTHPIAVVSVVSSGLIALSVYFFVRVKFGLTDPTVLNGASMTRGVYDTIRTEFSEYGNSNMYIYLQTPPGAVTSASFLKALKNFEDAAANEEGVVNTVSMLNPGGGYPYTFDEYVNIYANPTSKLNFNFTSSMVRPFGITNLKTVTYVEVAMRYTPYTRSAKHMVNVLYELIDVHFPSGMLVASGIAGRPALVRDLYKDLSEIVPGWISIMMISIFILLLIMTKSILIPIKAVVMSLLSLGATLGIIVLIFQEGGLSKELDFIPNGYLDGSNLVFVFSVAFGLAVDYELFLIAHVQDEYKRNHDNKLAVMKALQQTGSVITSAAIMLSLTTAAFLASTVSFIKLIGLGIAIAVMIDATVVRMLLVPATIVLLGDWNWYCPKILADAIDRLGIEERSGDWLKAENNEMKLKINGEESKTDVEAFSCKEGKGSTD